jgi:YidC/Oxa1 family membrane protein insertase
MNSRFFIALALTAIVIVVTPLVFPGAMTRKPSAVAADSIAQAGANRVTPADSARQTVPASPVLAPPTTSSGIAQASRQATPAETTTVHTRYSTYVMSARGGVPISVSLDSSYFSLRPGAKAQRQSAQLIQSSGAMTSYALALGRDTIALDTLTLRMDKEAAATTNTISYAGDAAGHAVRLAYTFATDSSNSFQVRASVTVANAPPGSALIMQLPRTLHSNEPDTLDDQNHLAVSYRPARGDVSSVAFAKLDTVVPRIEAGPINWVATRNKYFLIAYRAEKVPFSQLQLQGASRTGKVAAHALGKVTLPLAADGSAAFDIYAGPQNFERLQQLGGDIDQVNPYAGWLHAVVQPFATIVMKALLWMKRTTQLNYGWVLVLFGVLIKLVLWPLNQGAMRTSMKMQVLQPKLQELQKKYADDPKKQQDAIMKLYKEHGMSPLSPLMGCLPMLLPMPVLFALYYVFQNTIEFRGVPFLWLPDLSLRDPFYITPLLMGASMYVMSWVGMRNAPANPQAKMMSYMMPVMLTVLFLNFASGLNLYYAIQNIAGIPQQWLLAQERAKAKPSSASLKRAT